MPYKEYFTRSLRAAPERLHFAAHSHHLWPDASYAGHEQAWLDAASLADRKWDKVFSEVVPEARGHIARILNLSDPSTITLAPNVHELFVRVVSCIEKPCLRVLATDGEFHSFSRQSKRLEEAGRMEVTRIPVEPFETFDERFLAAASSEPWDLVYVSQVFFDSGFVFERFTDVANAVTDEALVMIDGYHGFMALPTDLRAVEQRVFYTAGGYKYAMSGEGVCFLHCPPSYGPRPLNTGWFAGFGALASSGAEDEVPYAADGSRFAGSTTDPTPVYRFNAVMRMLEEAGLTVEVIKQHVTALHSTFLDQLADRAPEWLPISALIPGRDVTVRGNFLTFRRDNAGAIHGALLEAGVVTDYRRDRLRFGFGLYQDPTDVAKLIDVLAAAVLA